MDAENKLSLGANAMAPVVEGMDAAAMTAAASEAVIAALQALTLVPDANGQVVLPAGVELDDIRVSGRDLVITMPDGTQMVIPDGAIFVPQFVLDGVAVPPLNIAALLISKETAPEAGRPTSSGGNFADAVGDIGDPFARGDLLPPTQLAFGEPEEKEIIPDLVDEEPTTIFITPDQPAGSVSATARVNEAGLPARGSEPPGSNETATSETTAGSIVFETPDGFGSLTLNGTAITTVGQVIVTPFGRLTITSIAPGNIGYSYTLTDNTSGDNTADVFAVVVTDSDGDVATANLTISIIDDVPTARSDTDAVAVGTYGPETGNVLTGVGTTSGSAGADTQGADGAVLTGVRAGVSGAFVAPGGTLVGAYGTLTLNANGSYSYVRNPGTAGGVNDVFTYQITDGDGDTSTATLTISIGDAAPATAANATVLLDDDALAGGNPGGTGDDVNSANTSGTLAASGGDGPLAWSLSTGGAPAGFTYVANGTGIDVLQGTTVVLRVTLNTATGAYTVTQLAPIQHAAGADENNAGFTLSYQVTDRDGDAATGNLTISVDDDTPIAVNDTDIIASGTYGPATGNVITDTEGDGGADSVGADGGAAVSAITGFGGAGTVGGTTAGQYGVLTLNANGSYSYVRNAGTAGGVNDVFTYTLRDADGDTVTATLTVTIQDAAPIAGENAAVLLDDDALAGGNPGGTGDDPNAANTAGTLAAAGGDGPLTWALSTSGAPAGFSYVANGTGIDILQGTTLVMRVTLNTANGGYTVTHLAPIQHPAGGNENNLGFNLGYTATDRDGDAATGVLSINVDDDTPVAANDTDSIASGTYGPATGNVLTDAEGDGGADSRGADGGAVTAISGFGGAGAVGGSTNGQYGILTLNADGTYSYVRNPGTGGGVSDVFIYTLTDGDGDAVMATLTITIADSPTTLNLPTAGGAGTVVDEAGLPAGSNAASTSETTAGTIGYTAPDGPAIVTIDDVAVTAVGQTFTGAFGTLTITSIAGGAIGYSYTLTTNTSGDNTFDDFAILVTDQDGDSSPGTLVIDIVDDVPTARPDVDSVTEDAFVGGEGNPVADGNVITGAGGSDTNTTDGVADTRGADGASVTAVAFGATAGTVGGLTAGQYGTLTLNANGSYSYVLNNFDPRVQGLDGDDTLTEVFTYTLTDGDGDVRTTTLTITINGSDDPITINGLSVEGPDLIVDEDDLSDGSSPNAAALTQSGTFTVNGTDGIASILIEGANVVVGQTFTTAFGVFTITSVSSPVDGSATAITIGYSYTLTDNTAHPVGSGQNFITEVFDITVTDTDGSTDSDTIEVRIIDDVPTAVNDTDTIPGGSNSPATGNVITDAEGDGGADTRGADGGNVTAITGFGGAGAVGGITNGQYGVLTLNGDGSYSYVRNSGSPGNVSDVFTYTLTDGDGDTSTATLTITILDAAPVTGVNATVLLDDDALAGGNPGGTGDDVDAASTSGTLSGSGGDGALTWAYLTSGAPAGFSYAVNGTGIDILQGATVVLRVTLNATTGAYTVTQLAPIDHPAGSNENNQGFILNYTVSDIDGDSAPGTLSINVDDDTPVVQVNGVASNLVVDETTLATNDTENLSGLFTTPTLYGADGAGSVAYSLGVVAGPSGLVDTLTGNAVVLTLEAGVVIGRAGPGGAVVFAVSVDASGNVTLDQSRAVVHTPNGGPNDVATLSSNLVTLTQTVTDGDGDTASATANIGGMLRFVDDAPTAGANAAVQLDDDALAGGNAGGTGDVNPNTANTNGTLSHTFGNDGGSIAFATTGAPAGYRYTASGSNILIQQEQGAGNWVTVATVTLNAATGAYTVTQNAAIIHPAGGNENDVSFTLGYTVTDGDGDTATSALVINVDDDTPVAVAGSQSGIVDEDGLAGGIPGGTGDVAGVATTATGSVTGLFSGGADAPLTYQLTGSTAGLPALTSGGVAITYALAGNVLTASAGVNPVFTLTLNATTGQWDFALLRPLDHPTGANENDIVLQFGGLLQATDNDGDTVAATGTLTVTIDDDTPIAANDSNSVTEEGPLTATGNVLTGAGADSLGADGPGAGGAVTAVSGGTIGTNFNTTYGTLTLNANGTYTYALNNANATVQALDTGETLLEVFTYTITDRDGDTTTATLTITINGTNDAPVVTPATTAVSEEGLLGSNPDATGSPDTTNLAIVTGTVTATDADVEPLTFTLGTPALALTSNGVAITWTGAGSGTLVGSAGALEVIRVVIDSSGNFTVTLSDQVDHPVTGSEDSLSLVVPVNVSDGTATSSTTLTIGIQDDSPTAIVTATTSGTVDEDGLAGGIAGGTGDVAGVATAASGSVSGLFSVGADALATYSLSTNTSGLPALTSGGVAITYAVSGNVLTASAGVNAVFTLTLNATTGQWDFALLRPLDHPTGANENDIVLQFGGMIIATDRDGDPVTATGTLTVTIDDDTPVANNDGTTQATENAAITINVFANDQGGADGTLASSVAVVGGSLSGVGTLVNNGNGTFTYTPGAGETGAVTFQYTITDRDGDTATATATITLLADSTPVPVNVVAAVDDDALAGGLAGGTGDIDANTGEPGGTPSEAVYTGAIAVNFGGDTGTVSFANLHGTSGTVGTETVNYTWNAGTNTLTATGPRGALFTVSLTPSGAYTVTLVDNVLHAAGGNETSVVATLNYLATDSDGDSSTAGTLAITFNDDTPTLGIIQNQQISSIPSDPVATGTLHFAPGADGAGTTMTIGANLTGITSGGRNIVTQQVGNVLTGYADVDSSGTFTAGDTAVFTLTVNPTAGTSGQYVFDLLAPLDGSTVNIAVGSGSSFGSGPSNSVVVSDNATAQQLAIVTGWTPTGGFTAAELAAWQAGGIPDLTQQSAVNGSTAGWGLFNNNFDGGEFLRFDFGVVNDYDAAGPYVPPAAGPFANVSYATFGFTNFGSGDTVIFVAHYTNGTTATFTRIGGTDPNTFTITSPAGTQLAWVDVYESTGTIKLDLLNVGVTSTVVDRTIPFTLTLTDGDGDATTTNAFSVRVGGGLSPFTPAAMEGPPKYLVDVSEPMSSPNSIATATQAQIREQVQANSLIAASLVALAVSESPMHDTETATIRELGQLRDLGIDGSVRSPLTADPTSDAGRPVLDHALAIDAAGPVQQNDMPDANIWETTGLAPQELPVAQYAPVQPDNLVQLPDSGAPMLTLPTDTGLIDALLLVRGMPADAIEPQVSALQEVIADAVNDNGIDQLLDQLTGPVDGSLTDNRSPQLDAGHDIAGALIDMPVMSDAIAHFSSVSISDQLQEMATT